MAGNLNIWRINEIDVEFPFIFKLNGYFSDNEFYIINDIEELNNLCLHLIKDFDFHLYEKEPVPPKGLTKETINNLPESLQENAKMLWKDYEYELSNYKEIQYQKEIFEKALAGDHKSARLFIEVQGVFNWEIIFPQKIERIKT